MTKMGSITGHRIDYNGVGALRGQRHILSAKIYPSTSPPSPFRTWQTFLNLQGKILTINCLYYLAIFGCIWSFSWLQVSDLFERLKSLWIFLTSNVQNMHKTALSMQIKYPEIGAVEITGSANWIHSVEVPVLMLNMWINIIFSSL